jgi:hypothetical protein
MQCKKKSAKRKKETAPEKKKGMEVCHSEPAPTSAP